MMKFDVIIGNPPYQASDGGHGSSAKPIYNIFIEKSIELEPRYLSMIAPSRWMNGGKGLNDFRKKMKEDKRLKLIVDNKDSSKFFNGVVIRGGINYFLWDKNHNGLCNFNGVNRDINEFENIIRDNESISILNKINKNPSLLSGISTRKPFGIETNFTEYKEEKSDLNSIKIYGNRNLMKETDGIGYVSLNQIEKGFEFIDKHKVIIPYAGGNSPVGIILPKPFYSEPNSICSETYIILKILDSKYECERLISYIKTKFFRFLVGLIKDTQHATKRVYGFVPDLPLDIEWTDEKLYKKYNLTQYEIQHIESMIRPM